MRRSVYNHVLARESLAVATRTATANGTGVDRHVGSNAFRSMAVVIHTGSITAGTHTFSLEDSDNGSTWAAVPADQIQGTLPAAGTADSSKVFEAAYLGHRRHARVVVTVSGATPSGTYGALILLGGARRTPVARS